MNDGFYNMLRKLNTQFLTCLLLFYRHRDEFKERFKDNHPYEKSLFHGCKGESIDAIINQNFNRAYAGVNGKLIVFYLLSK